ncbi:MAG: aminoacyl-tRNA hydrolase [Ilumatobacteraceae bacterium]|jgi:PTH1 family peptidyl-tRNA hydrolase|nr:aminoacyl-tRNA hydrolase [Ilumatobacteraceae bacterium]
MGLFGRSSRSSDSSGKNSSSFDALVVGLGNPGKQYARSRHNVGEEVVVELARRGNEALKSGRDSALVAEVRITNATQNTKRAVLAFPTTFMNESGQAVRKLMRRYGFKSVDALIVIQDELDLAPGTVKIKKGGGLSGHNGLRSIASHVATQEFIRVRLGVGKPSNKEQGANHVLSKVPAAERQLLDVAVNIAADAVEKIILDGVDAAMNMYNTL